jgi:hypothetical protein
VTDLRLVSDDATSREDDIRALLDAQVSLNTTVREYLNMLAADIVRVRGALTLQRLSLDALTEQLDQAATRDDLDSLRSELLGLVAQPFSPEETL